MHPPGEDHGLRITLILAALAVAMASWGVAAIPPSVLPVASSTAAPGAERYPPSPPPANPPQRERAEEDLPEPLPEATACWCTHLIYFRPSDRPDQRLDTNGTIDASARSLRAWFVQQSGRQPRIDRVGSTSLFDITHVAGSKKSADYTSLSSITDELKARGLSDPSKRYLVYAAVDRGTTCGEATVPYPLVSAATYALIYMDSLPCSARDFGNGTASGAATAETIAAHEWLHAEGVVPVTAPRHCTASPYHVCTAGLWLVPASATGSQLDPESSDVMFPLIDARLSKKALDRDRDDYLDHPWMTHRNLRDSAFLEPA